MRQKHLESMLSSAKREFGNPDITLEQYPTSPLLTASTVLAAGKDVGEGRTVVDLGCGTGMLALACALLDTDFVIAIDCDPDALTTAKENAEHLEVEDRILFVQAHVATRPKPSPASKKAQRVRKPQQQQQSKQLDPLPSCTSGFPLRENCVDTVLTNPPFGTKHNQGMDMQFLELGCHLARSAVYSFHKTSTRDFVLRTIEKKTGCPAKVVAEMKFDLGRTYKFHKSKSVDVEVDLIRVDTSQKSTGTCCEEESPEGSCDDT